MSVATEILLNYQSGKLTMEQGARGKKLVKTHVDSNTRKAKEYASVARKKQIKTHWMTTKSP